MQLFFWSEKVFKIITNRLAWNKKYLFVYDKFLLQIY